MSEPRLTPAEHKLAELLLCSQSSGDIARILKRSPDTIKHHLSSMYRKFGVSGEGLYAPLLRLALIIHERREALGVRCETCEHLEAGSGVRVRELCGNGVQNEPKSGDTEARKDSIF